MSFLELKFNDLSIATGTAFFWQVAQRKYLVTNWHNVTGRITSLAAYSNRSLGSSEGTKEPLSDTEIRAFQERAEYWAG